MTVKVVLALVLLTAGCNKQRTLALPATAGQWNLESSRELPLGAAPAPSASYGLKRVLEGHYSGPVPVVVTAYEVKAGTAFELMQKWRREPGKFSFYTENLLVEVQPRNGQLDRAALDRFSRAFEREIAGH